MRRIRHLGVGEVRFWSPWVPMIRRHEKGCNPSSQGANESGMSVLELLITVLIIGTIVGASVLVTDQVLPTVRADAALRLVQSQVLLTRQMAMDQRRNFNVTFKNNNELLIVRQELAPGVTTTISDYLLPNGATYKLYTGVLDTPDGLGNTQAVDFTCGSSTIVNAVVFVSDGTVTDPTGTNICNGSVFMGIGNKQSTARALTVMGASTRIRGYRVNGNTFF